MPECRECHDEVAKLVSVKVAGKARKVCADCADRLREEGEVAEASEGVIQGMMGYKGRR
jgi:protein-arginine kinase activator protein McsA